MDLDLQEFKYTRYGFVYTGTFSDKCVVWAIHILPPKNPDLELPKFWRYKGPEHFMETYGDGIAWIKTVSYHQLIINGWRVCRFWTLSPKTMRIEWYDKSSISFKEKQGLEPFKDYVTDKIKGRYGL